jgi:hypothetical protein
MNLIKYIIFLVILLKSNYLFAENFIGVQPLCGNYNKDISLIDIKKINIEINKSSSWYKNLIKAALSNKNFIIKSYKKKFKSNISFHLINGTICETKALVRISGDFKDHLEVKNPNNMFASLDVQLIEGNIDNIVNFKLFLPDTKFAKNSIIFGAILEEIGFFKRRERIVKVEVNDREKNYLFLEKFSKEFIENNNQREGPIITIAEDLLWLDDGQNFDYFLGKVYNRNWASKNINNLNISKRALDLINIIYLNYHIRHRYFDENNRHDLNFEILENAGYEIKQLRFLEMLLLSFNADHGLFVNNRKYFFDPLYKKFYPLSYDEMPRFGISNENELKKNQIFFKKQYSNRVKEMIKEIDVNSLLKKISEKGFELNSSEINKILNDAVTNLDLNIEYNLKNKKNINFKDLFVEDYFSKINNYNYDKIFSDDKLNFFKCTSEKKCKQIKLDLFQKSKILGNKKLKNISLLKNEFFHYIGNKDFYFNNKINEKKLGDLVVNQVDDINILYEKGMEFKVDKENKVINIFEKQHSKKLVIFKSNIKNHTIIYHGLKSNYSGKEINNDILVRNDDHNLTGCLNIYDSNLENVIIKLNQSSCEDGVNFVRSKGSIEYIHSLDSLSDAVDFDFSHIKIQKIKINKSKNDCIDFSYGNYFIKEIQTSSCGDKSVSIGEKSNVKIENFKDFNSITSIAVKDSAKAHVDFMKSEKTKNCALAYRKKQEFAGGQLTIKNINCENKVTADTGSMINLL